MFNLTQSNDDPKTIDRKKLDEIIDDLLDFLDSTDPGTDAYKNGVEQLGKLQDIKSKNDTSSPSWMPSPDAMLGAIASVATVALIIHHEKIGFVTSKALGFVRSPFK